MDTLNRFLKHVRKTDTCWLWTSGLNEHGYGWVSRTRKLGPTRAHRMSYELHVGPIPKGMFVLHHCDNPPCVNPDHLYLGTQLDNVEDMRKRQRFAKGESASWSKVTEQDVRDMRASSDSQDVLAARYGLCQQSVSLIIRRVNWKHVA